MAQVIGKLVKLEPLMSGTNEKGDWIIQVFVLMTTDEHPRTVALRTFSQEKAAVLQSLKAGETLIVDYVPESREYNGKWFTDLRCTKIMVAQKQ